MLNYIPSPSSGTDQLMSACCRLQDGLVGSTESKALLTFCLSSTVRVFMFTFNRKFSFEMNESVVEGGVEPSPLKYRHLPQKSFSEEAE